MTLDDFYDHVVDNRVYGHRAPIVMCTYSIINYFSNTRVIRSIGVVNRNNCILFVITVY